MRTILPLLATAMVPLCADVAFAQEAGGRAVVQPLPPPAAEELKLALGRLARDPRNLDALIAAGTASLELDDVDAAIGFFGRAAELAPDDPRIKVGKAAAYVRTRRPDEGLRLFQEAEAQGVEVVRLAGDYGLAWDLVGNNREAQLRYRRALAAAPGNDEVSRRLALSYAIDGNAQAFEATLLPLLERRDFSAYRTRAFGLAILGKADDAVAISEAAMDRQMAAKLEPYLRFMPQLTKAQQAAAANLGIYPTAARIGRDDPRIAAFGGGSSGAPSPDSADTALAPAGAPFTSAAPGRATAATSTTGPVVGVIADNREEAERRVEAARRDAASDPLARTSERVRVVEVRREDSPAGAPPAATVPIVARTEAGPPAPLASAQTAGATRFPEASSGAELPPVMGAAGATPPPVVVARLEPAGVGPGFDLGNASGSGTSVPAPQSSAKATEPASVADAFSDLAAVPVAAARLPAAGSVDITAIKAPREVEAKEPEVKTAPAKPLAPSRYWVQVATGQDKSALKFDWRRLSKQADGMLEGKGPFVTAWGQTNRLLAGPYKSREDARKALKELQEKGFDAFTFTSPEGQQVDELR